MEVLATLVECGPEQIDNKYKESFSLQVTRKNKNVSHEGGVGENDEIFLTFFYSSFLKKLDSTIVQYWNNFWFLHFGFKK